MSFARKRTPLSKAFTMTNTEQGRVGVLLANTGTPASPAPRDVHKYLTKFLMDKRIRPMNPLGWWCILHFFILPKRDTKSGEKYAKIWTPEGSPFDVEHEKLREHLQRHFDAAGQDVRVAVGQSYGAPTIREALGNLRNEGCERVVVLPLYPQSAYSTTLSVDDSVKHAMHRMRWDAPVELVERYGTDEAYIAALAQTVRDAGFDAQEGDRLLFNYHSIPLTDIEAGDTYEPQTGATALAVAGKLGLDRKAWTVGYNCQFDKGRSWLEPFSRHILTRWAQARAGRVFMICPNFAVDCLETLYDIDYELIPHYKQALADAGRVYAGSEFVYVPCLNGTKQHADVLAHVLAPYLDGKEHHGQR